MKYYINVMMNNMYIYYRKSKAAVSYIIYSIMFMKYSIKKDKVVFSSTEGMGGYGDNPKAIAEELHNKYPQIELVWLVNDLKKSFPPYVRKVKNSLWKRAYELATSKVWVDCHRKPYGTRKRHGQYYIQTWHGPIGFKPAGALRGKFLPKIAEIISRDDSAMIDCFVTNSNWSTDIARRSFFYDGHFLEAGSPRCDLFFKSVQFYKRKIREIYNLPQTAKIFIYAPTFRAGSQDRKRRVEVDDITLNLNKIINVLQQKTDEEWYIALRLHPQVAANMEKYPLGKYQKENIIDVSQYDDMYELIAAADMLLSDYSTVAFDASYLLLPVFLYADDLDEYQRDRGKLLWDMHKLPFPFAETEYELIENIKNFDQISYKKDLKNLFAEVKLKEDGKASQRVVDQILEYME